MSTKNVRKNLWSCVVYVDPANLFSEFKPRGLRYCYIKHNGEPFEGEDSSCDKKRDHWHLLLHFRNAVRLWSVQEWFRLNAPEDENIFAEPCYSCSSMLRYFTHDGTDKQKYDRRDIVMDDPQYWMDYQFCDDESKITLMSMLEDIHNHVSYRIMVLTYGRDYVLHREQYELMAQLLFAQELDLNSVREGSLESCEEGSLPREFSIPTSVAFFQPSLKQILCSTSRCTPLRINRINKPRWDF